MLKKGVFKEILMICEKDLGEFLIQYYDQRRPKVICQYIFDFRPFNYYFSKLSDGILVVLC